VKRWLQLQGYPGLNPALDEYSDDAPTVSLTPAIGSLAVEYDDPKTYDPPIDDWLHTECHVSTSSGFTPDASTLAAIGRQTRFEINGLVPGTTYYVKLVIVDSAGNKSTISSQQTIATQKVGPYHENEDREHGELVLNNDFGAQTLAVADNEPDYWSMDTGTWGSSDDAYVNTSVHQTGARSIEFISNLTDPVILISEVFPVTTGFIYMVESAARAATIPAGANFDVWVRWYQEDKVTAGTPASTQVITQLWSALAANTWYRFKAPAIEPPSDARYARLLIRKDVTSTAFTSYCDYAKMYRMLVSFHVIRGSAQSINELTWTQVDWNNDTSTNCHNYGDHFDITTNNRFDVPYDGAYQFHAQISWGGTVAVGDPVAVRIKQNTTVIATSEFVPIQYTGQVITSSVSTAVTEMSAGDYVTVEVYHEDVSSTATKTVLSSVDCYFTGAQVTF